MSILEINNLNLSFIVGGKEYQALYDVSLTLDEGKMLAIVGESGSGKTITAMSVLKLLPSNAKILSGEVIYKNRNLLALPEKEMQKIRGKEIALIPQDPMTSLNPLFTIGSQLLEIIEIHQGLRGEEANKLAVEALEMVQIPNAKERLKAYPHEFSGGMRQRVIIAMALACNSQIIIADEPTTALDVTVQAQIMELIKQIQKEMKTSFIFISHDFGLVYEAADVVSVMYAGRIVESSPARELFKNPKHPYTKALINSLPDFNTQKLIPIDGQPPSIKDNFTGCPFEPRCISKIDICKNCFPSQKEINETLINCHLYK